MESVVRHRKREGALSPPPLLLLPLLLPRTGGMPRLLLLLPLLLCTLSQHLFSHFCQHPLQGLCSKAVLE